MNEETIEKIKSEMQSIMDYEKETSDDTEFGEKAGNSVGKSIMSYQYKPNLYNYFKEVVDRWLSTFEFEKEEDQFIFIDPFLELVSEKMLMPSAHEEDSEKNQKNNLWVFLDASYSCVDYIPDFIKVCMGIPSKYFDTTLFSFTTKVAKIKIEKDKYTVNQALGGTSFGCIKNYINDQIKKSEVKPPDYVFVLTDGYAEKIIPNIPPPERWHFFITPMGKKGNQLFDLAIPDKAKCHNFKNIK